MMRLLVAVLAGNNYPSVNQSKAYCSNILLLSVCRDCLSLVMSADNTYSSNSATYYGGAGILTVYHGSVMTLSSSGITILHTCWCDLFIC